MPLPNRSHIAHADHANTLGLHIDTHFGEVALHGDPCTARGNAHRLMIIAVGAAAGEGIAQPEAALSEIALATSEKVAVPLSAATTKSGVLAIVHDHALGMRHRSADDIIGNGEQRADENAIAFGAFRQPRVAVDGGTGELLGVEAKLGAGGHDHGILHPLRLHQAQNLGAEVVAPV